MCSLTQNGRQDVLGLGTLQRKDGSRVRAILERDGTVLRKETGEPFAHDIDHRCVWNTKDFVLRNDGEDHVVDDVPLVVHEVGIGATAR